MSCPLRCARRLVEIEKAATRAGWRRPVRQGYLVFTVRSRGVGYSAVRRLFVLDWKVSEARPCQGGYSRDVRP